MAATGPMEGIAEAAEVAPRTLYRYFASKDLIILDPISGNRDFSAAFSQHAVNLSVEEALSEAIPEWARWQDANAEELLLVRSLIDQAPIARAKLWDIIYQRERALSARLAEKLHLPGAESVTRSLSEQIDMTLYCHHARIDAVCQDRGNHCH